VKRFHYNFPDPAKARGTEDEVMGEFRKVREQIKAYTQQFVEQHLTEAQ
jgi:arsenate reductase